MTKKINPQQFADDITKGMSDAEIMSKYQIPTKTVLNDLFEKLISINFISRDIIEKRQNSRSGYIYILINPSLPGKLKIGKTQNTPEQRAKELSASTGVPTPFIIAYEIIVSDCDIAEKEIHAQLEKQGCRVSANREFFDLSLKDAVKVVNEICTQYPQHLILKTTQLAVNPSRQKSGKTIFMENMREFIEDEHNRNNVLDINCGWPYYYFRNTDNSICPLPTIIREKLELSATLGCTEAKGWLLFDDALSYFCGLGVLQDEDLFVDNLLGSLKHNFVGAYAVLANIIRDSHIIYFLEPPQLGVSYRKGSNYINHIFSSISSRKLMVFDPSFKDRIDRSSKISGSTSEMDKLFYESQNLIDAHRGAINLLKKGLNSGLIDLCPRIIMYAQELYLGYRSYKAEELFFKGEYTVDDIERINQFEPNFWNIVKQNESLRYSLSKIATEQINLAIQCIEIQINKIEESALFMLERSLWALEDLIIITGVNPEALNLKNKNGIFYEVSNSNYGESKASLIQDIIREQVKATYGIDIVTAIYDDYLNSLGFPPD